MIRPLQISVATAGLAVFAVAGLFLWSPVSKSPSAAVAASVPAQAMSVPEPTLHQVESKPNATRVEVAQAEPTAPETAPPAAAAAVLPGGASSLTEQHGDWTVTCAIAEAVKRCAFSQALIASQSGQRVLSLELTPTPDGATLQGTLMAPFSLRFDTGISLSIDETPLAGPLPFLSCIEIGCIVPVRFDAAAIAALRAGTGLKFAATALSGGQPVELNLSLSGFPAAQNRTQELLR